MSVRRTVHVSSARQTQPSSSGLTGRSSTPRPVDSRLRGDDGVGRGDDGVGRGGDHLCAAMNSRDRTLIPC